MKLGPTHIIPEAVRSTPFDDESVDDLFSQLGRDVSNALDQTIRDFFGDAKTFARFAHLFLIESRTVTVEVNGKSADWKVQTTYSIRHKTLDELKTEDNSYPMVGGEGVWRLKRQTRSGL